MSTQSRGLFARLAGQPCKTNSGRVGTGYSAGYGVKTCCRSHGLLGTLFVGALKAVAPVLVLMLVMASIANHQHGQKPTFGRSSSCIFWAPSPLP